MKRDTLLILGALGLGAYLLLGRTQEVSGGGGGGQPSIISVAPPQTQIFLERLAQAKQTEQQATQIIMQESATMSPSFISGVQTAARIQGYSAARAIARGQIAAAQPYSTTSAVSRAAQTLGSSVAKILRK